MDISFPFCRLMKIPDYVIKKLASANICNEKRKGKIRKEIYPRPSK